MKRTIIIVSSVVLVAAVAVVTPLILINNNKPASQYDVFISAMVEEANHRVLTAKTPNNERSVIPGSALKNYPASFDLRSVDTNGDGVKENYVTGVKFQNPFGTCWAFGTIAAAETSILYDLKQDSRRIDQSGNTRDSIDLSEHHLAWFTYDPIPEGNSQAGEGLYSTVKDVDKNISLRLNSGSTQFAGSTMFASGIGPVQEPDFYTEISKKTQLNYHGKNKNTTTNKKGYEIYSKDDDWSIDEEFRYSSSYMLEDTYFLPNPITYDSLGFYDIDYADRVVKTYKEQLTKGRAICISFCADNYSPSAEDRAAKYINVDTYAHYCYKRELPNHSVCVVGWDDNYSKDNFLSEVQLTKDGKPVFDDKGNPIMIPVAQPPKDGAWIVKNSWGSLDSISDGLVKNEWGFDNTGYFYLSYYDLSIDCCQCFDFDVTGRMSSDLGNYSLEQYDLMPSEKPHSVTCDFPVSEANVFAIKQRETIKDVSCVTTEFNEEVNCSIYRANNGKLDLLHPLSNVDICFQYPGLHVFNLPEAIDTNVGDNIAVVLTHKCGNKYLLSIGSEFNKKGYDAGLCEDNYYANGVVNKNESYVIINNLEAYDFHDIKEKLENMGGPTSFLTYDNFPIKVYASTLAN